jgi:hypothetical protein
VEELGEGRRRVVGALARARCDRAHVAERAEAVVAQIRREQIEGRAVGDGVAPAHRAAGERSPPRCPGTSVVDAVTETEQPPAGSRVTRTVATSQTAARPSPLAVARLITWPPTGSAIARLAVATAAASGERSSAAPSASSSLRLLKASAKSSLVSSGVPLSSK